MDEFSMEPFDSTEAAGQTPESPAPGLQKLSDDDASPISQIREFFHSQFAGVSSIWPTSVCGH